MRQITKTLSLPVGDETREFRITKLDAFSGVRVLKMLNASSAETIQELLFSLPENELDALMKTCLHAAEISLPAGYIRVWDAGCWALPELEFETVTCFRLTQEVLAWTLQDFFPDAGPAS